MTQDLKKLKIVALFLALIMAVLIAPNVYAADMEIEMLNRRDDGAKMVYNIDVARIDAGDTMHSFSVSFEIRAVGSMKTSPPSSSS